MFCSSIGFFEILKSRFGDLGGVEEGWVVGVGVVVMVVIIGFGIIIRVIIIMVVVVVVVFFEFICVVLVVTVLQIQIPHRRSRIKSRCRYCCSRPCFPTSQIPMIRKRSRNVRRSLRTIGTGCVGFLVVVVVAAAAVQRNTSLVILNTSSTTTTTHHRAPDISLLSLIRNFQLTNRN